MTGVKSFLISCMLKCKIHVKHFCYRVKDDVWPRRGGEWMAQIWSLQLWAKLAPFLMAHHFYLKKTTDRKTTIIKTYNVWKIFSKMSKVNLSAQKKLTDILTNDKTWAFKEKFLFWKICILHESKKAFLMRLSWFTLVVILTNVMFCHYTVKCSNIWNRYITLCTNKYYPQISKSSIVKRSIQSTT